MTDRTILQYLFLLGAILAMSFMLAACSSQKSEQPDKAPTSKPPGTQEPTPRSTPPVPADSPAAAEREAAERMGAARTALGDRVEIRRPWVQVRNKPGQDAPAIALAFGNDRFPVLEQQEDWVRVQLDGNRDGWIPVAATQEP